MRKQTKLLGLGGRRSPTGRVRGPRRRRAAADDRVGRRPLLDQIRKCGAPSPRHGSLTRSSPYLNHAYGSFIEIATISGRDSLESLMDTDAGRTSLPRIIGMGIVHRSIPQVEDLPLRFGPRDRSSRLCRLEHASSLPILVVCPDSTGTATQRRAVRVRGTSHPPENVSGISSGGVPITIAIS
jgi:hypothetical protein